MKLSILTSTFKGLVFPLTASVTKNEGIDFSKLQVAVCEEDGTKSLRMMAVQPTFMASVVQPLNADDEEAAIDNEAVADNTAYEVDNRLLASMLRNIGNASIDMTVTTDGMDIFAGDSHFYLDAIRTKGKVNIPIVTTDDDEVDNISRFRILGTFTAGSLPALLGPAIRMARSAGKDACLKSKAVHLIFGRGDRVAVEGMSNVGMLTVEDGSSFTLADKDSETSRHFAIPLVAAERLLSMATVSGREVDIAYDPEGHRIIAWCNPFCINMMTEDVDCCNAPYEICASTGVELSVNALACALQKVKATGNDKVHLVIAPTGGIEVLAPNGKFSVTLAERVIGSLRTNMRLALPLNTLLAVMRGYEDEKVVMWFDDLEVYVKVMSRNEGHRAYVLRV